MADATLLHVEVITFPLCCTAQRLFPSHPVPCCASNSALLRSLLPKLARPKQATPAEPRILDPTVAVLVAFAFLPWQPCSDGRISRNSPTSWTWMCANGLPCGSFNFFSLAVVACPCFGAVSVPGNYIAAPLFVFLAAALRHLPRHQLFSRQSLRLAVPRAVRCRLDMPMAEALLEERVRQSALQRECGKRLVRLVPCRPRRILDALCRRQAVVVVVRGDNGQLELARLELGIVLLQFLLAQSLRRRAGQGLVLRFVSCLDGNTGGRCRWCQTLQLPCSDVLIGSR